MKRKRDSSGTTLLEILLSIGTASLLLLTLVLLFTHSQKIFFGEGNASEELRSLGNAMQTLSDKLSTGSIYLVKANLNFLLGEPSSKITVEQFSSLYHSDSFHTFSFMDHHLIEQDYPAFNTFSLTQALQKPDKKIILASHLHSVIFTFKPPHSLLITFQEEHLILRTEISTIKFSLEFHS